MKKILLSLSLLLCSFYAASAIETVSHVVPRSLYIYDINGGTFIDLKPSGCNHTSKYYLSPNHPKYDAIFSLLLSAQLANKPVTVKFDGCINGTDNPRGNIVGITLD